MGFFCVNKYLSMMHMDILIRATIVRRNRHKLFKIIKIRQSFPR